MAEIMKIEMLLVVNEDWEDEDGTILEENLNELLQGKEGILGVAAAREIASKPVEDEFDEYPLYDDGQIWKEF
jgi:hypothetical protein